jgi:NAD(P)H-hydrate repair Nnr-like enzyme with NAD(P)H-hydrate epimerase domain
MADAFAPAPTAQLPLELYRAEQVRGFDRAAIEGLGIPGATLMARAGAAAFRALRARWPEARRLAVVCGAGNNGGDGYVVARLAREAGLEAGVLAVADPARLRGDALGAAAAARDAGVPFAAFDPSRAPLRAVTTTLVVAPSPFKATTYCSLRSFSSPPKSLEKKPVSFCVPSVGST